MSECRFLADLWPAIAARARLPRFGGVGLLFVGGPDPGASFFEVWGRPVACYRREGAPPTVRWGWFAFCGRPRPGGELFGFWGRPVACYRREGAPPAGSVGLVCFCGRPGVGATLVGYWVRWGCLCLRSTWWAVRAILKAMAVHRQAEWSSSWGSTATMLLSPSTLRSWNNPCASRRHNTRDRLVSRGIPCVK